jgi:O-antigen/teichoic acid export membrane protein
MGKTTAVTEIDFQDKPSISVNLSWMLFGNFFYGFCQWGYLILFAKFTSPEAVGRFSLGLAVSAPVVMLLNMQARTILATDGTNNFRFAEFFSFRILTNIIAIAILSGIVAVSGYRGETAAVILILGMSKLFEATSDIIMGYFQKHERMHIISTSLILRGLTALIALGAVVYVTESLVWGVSMLAASWALVLMFYDIPMLSKNKSSNFDYANIVGILSSRKGVLMVLSLFNMKAVRVLATMAIPLGFISLLLSLSTNIPKYFIEKISGQEALGYFAAMVYLILIGSKFINAVGQVVIPRLSKYYLAGRKADFCSLFWKGTASCALLGSVMVLSAFLFGEQILSLLYGPEYARHSRVFLWIMISGAFEYLAIFYWLTLIATRQINIQMPFNLAYILFLMGACTLLVPAYGLWGGAYAMVIVSFIKASANLILNLRASR